MGKRDRERIEQLQEGKGKSFRNRLVAGVAHRKVVKELSKGTVSEQTSRLNTLAGESPKSKVKMKLAIMKNAPKEIDKGIKKFRKSGIKITVDSLLDEVRSTSGFLQMCENLGITYEWFEELAEERMKVNKVVGGK